MTDLEPLTADAEALVLACLRSGLTVATAESCTGGLVAAAITEIPGSSGMFDRGFVTYANAAKTAVLGVPEEMLARVGAVSREVAIAMAEGARGRAGTSLAVSVTGIAGPGGGSALKPVGLVHFAVAQAGGETLHEEHRFADESRSAIRLAATRTAIGLLLRAAEAGSAQAGDTP